VDRLGARPDVRFEEGPDDRERELLALLRRARAGEDVRVAIVSGA
jgi:hypothetical protein